MGMTRWRHVLLASMLTAAFATAAPEASAGPGSLIAGACTFELEVTTLSTGWRDVATPSGNPGECETSDGPADGYLDGEFGPFPVYDCVSGVGDGGAHFSLDFGGGVGPSWSNTGLDVTNNGSVIELVFFDLGSRHILGSGHFVQSESDTLSCLAGGTTVVWSGVIVFEDPVIEVP